MNDSTTLQFVGLDVHRDSIAIAVAKPDGQPAESLATVPNDVVGLIKRLQRLGPLESLRCCYEAGPTGFGLARRLIAAKIDCQVIAPSLIPVQPGARVKTDRRDRSQPGSLPSLGEPYADPCHRPDHRSDSATWSGLVTTPNVRRDLHVNNCPSFSCVTTAGSPASRPGGRLIRPGWPNRPSISRPSRTSWAIIARPLRWPRHAWHG